MTPAAALATIQAARPGYRLAYMVASPDRARAVFGAMIRAAPAEAVFNLHRRSIEFPDGRVLFVATTEDHVRGMELESVAYIDEAVALQESSRGSFPSRPSKNSVP